MVFKSKKKLIKKNENIVTGSAGFIGYHLCLKLQKNKK